MIWWNDGTQEGIPNCKSLSMLPNLFKWLALPEKCEMSVSLTDPDFESLVSWRAKMSILFLLSPKSITAVWRAFLVPWRSSAKPRQNADSSLTSALSLARSNVDNHPLPKKGFIDARHREGVLNGHCIDMTIVQTKSLATVPFLLQGPHSIL